MDDLRIVRRTFGRGRSVVLSWCIYIFDVAVLQLLSVRVCFVCMRACVRAGGGGSRLVPVAFLSFFGRLDVYIHGCNWRWRFRQEGEVCC